MLFWAAPVRFLLRQQVWGEQRKAATVTDHFLCNLVQTGLIELGVENPGTQRQLILAWETLQSVNGIDS